MLVMYCNCNNMIEHECNNLFIVHFAGFLLWFLLQFLLWNCVCAAIVMTVRLQPPPKGEGPLYAEKWTIKCSSIKSGVFPFTLHPLKERVLCNCSIFTQIVAQCTNRNPWITAVTPWMKKPECSSR